MLAEEEVLLAGLFSPDRPAGYRGDAGEGAGARALLDAMRRIACPPAAVAPAPPEIQQDARQ